MRSLINRIATTAVVLVPVIYLIAETAGRGYP
jgi:hypothetical protein